MLLRVHNVLLSEPRWQSWQKPRSLPLPAATTASAAAAAARSLLWSPLQEYNQVDGKKVFFLPLTFQSPASASHW